MDDAAKAAEASKRRRARNLAVGMMVAAFVVIIYLVTIVRIGGSIASKAV